MSKLQGVLFFCVLALGACSNSPEELERLRDNEQAGVERATEVQILYSDSAVLRVRINAPLMLNHLDPAKPRREFPEGVKVLFFNEVEQPTSQLTSRYAEYFEVERKVFLRDSVVVWNDQDERLETEELVWNEMDSTITSTKFVKITSPNQIIYGYGFRSNAQFSKWEIDRVRGTVQSRSMLDNPLQDEED